MIPALLEVLYKQMYGRSHLTEGILHASKVSSGKLQILHSNLVVDMGLKHGPF